MSEGDYNSLYHQLVTMEHELSDEYRPYKRAFGDLLGRCATAIFAMERFEEGNHPESYVEKLVGECVADTDVLYAATEIARATIVELETLIERAGKNVR